MRCPNCDRSKSRVTFTVNADQRSRKDAAPPDSILRTRSCSCGTKFKTIEVREELLGQALALLAAAKALVAADEPT